MSGHKQKGFSLIELSIAMLIVGLLASSALETYKNYSRQKVAGATSDATSAVSNAMSKFLTVKGRLPCPANPELLPSDPQSGKEQCRTDNLNAMNCNLGVCRIAGARDGGVDLSVGVNDPILVGSIPYIDLGLPEKAAYDGWGSKLTYAVSEYLAQPQLMNKLPPSQQIYKDDAGVIDVWVFNKIVGGVVQDIRTDYKTRFNAFPFIVLSHGPDKKGGYNRYGEITVACTNNQTRDDENCDGDNRFLDVNYRVLVEGPDFYDDYYLNYSVSTDSDMWDLVPGAVMKNKKFDTRVGIGTKTPDQKLDVEGDMRAEKVFGSIFCDKSGGNCFPAALFGSTGGRCNGGFVQAVKSAKFECGGIVNTSGITPGQCPGGQFMSGISPTGGILCSSP